MDDVVPFSLLLACLTNKHITAASLLQPSPSARPLHLPAPTFAVFTDDAGSNDLRRPALRTTRPGCKATAVRARGMPVGERPCVKNSLSSVRARAQASITSRVNRDTTCCWSSSDLRKTCERFRSTTVPGIL